ncbi:hypothetical protein [Streptomyces sp. NPDC023327]|uniref:hypothetical protein n=1 Tax=Streptomyces sp. NPDC023327 TaxID=3157088 RepID=UPI0033C34DF4
MWKKPTLDAADLGFSAFAERNQPRYIRYAQARLARKADVTTAVQSTLSFARQHWGWLLSQPNLAADVWKELRCQTSRQADALSIQDTAVAALYSALPGTSADSVVLCLRLGLPAAEAAELMGLEPPAVEAGLGVARRLLPRLAEGGTP